MNEALAYVLLVLIGFAAGIGGGMGFAWMLVRQMDRKIEEMAVRFDKAVSGDG